MMPLSPLPNRNAGRDCSWAWPGHGGARHKTAGAGAKSPANLLVGVNSGGCAAPSAPPKRSKQPYAPLPVAFAATGAFAKSP